MPPQIVENMLWYRTEPGDIVVDPFAGGGTTIDVAKRMGRRVWASDIRGNHYSPHLPIHKHDILTGWPDDAPNRADLVLLDPPYWRQARGRYSDDPHELAEMDLAAFYAAWRDVVTCCAQHAKQIAYIISPTRAGKYMLPLHRDLVVDGGGRHEPVLTRAWNAQHCQPPLPAEEITTIIESVAGRELRRRKGGCDADRRQG